MRMNLSLVSLEERAQPSATVQNLPTGMLGILPGAQHKVLDNFQITNDNSGPLYLSDVDVVPLFGSIPFYGNVNNMTLEAKMGDQYEPIAVGTPNPYTQDVDFHFADSGQAIWLGTGQTAKFRVAADFPMGFSGNKLGVQVAVDLWEAHGPRLDGSMVNYTGTAPVMHQVKDHVLDIYQMQMPNQTETVSAGQHDVPLIEFGTFSNTTTWSPIKFRAVQGNLDLAENYRLVHMDESQNIDASIKGGVSGKNLTFQMKTALFQGGHWVVIADIKSADQLPINSTLQLGIAKDSSWYSMDTQANKLMYGRVINGVGQGQVQIWSLDEMATSYVIQTQGGLTVSLGAYSPGLQWGTNNQEITAAQFDLTARGDSYSIQSVKLFINPVAVVTYVSLWDEGRVVSAAPVGPQGEIDFNNLNLVVPGGSTKTLMVKIGLGNQIADLVNAKVVLGSMFVIDSHGTSSNLGFSVFGGDIYVSPYGVG